LSLRDKGYGRHIIINFLRHGAVWRGLKKQSGSKGKKKQRKPELLWLNSQRIMLFAESVRGRQGGREVSGCCQNDGNVIFVKNVVGIFPYPINSFIFAHNWF
jgi:hypothetical protein